MPLLEHPSPSLIGGVSQQDDSIVKPGKCSVQENAYPSPVEGLLKRHPTEHVAKMKDGTQGDALLHTIDRDANERYTVIITNSGIEVYDMDGAAVTVTDTTGGYGYLSGVTDAKKQFRVVTNNDYTFILNRTKEVEMTSATTAAAPLYDEGFLFVRQGNYKVNYNATITETSGASTLGGTVTTATWDGVAVAGGELNSIKTDDIAADLTTKINGLASGNATAVRSGSVIYVTNTTRAFTSFTATDSVGDSVLASAWKEVTQVEGYLPTICTHGFKVKVVGSGDSVADDYYVEFVSEGGPSTFGRGYWRETIDYATPYEIDATTMPHQLIRKADGTFEFSAIDWGDRTVGDETLVPNPSFVGTTSNPRTISDIFFFKDRMGFVSDENVILSEQGQYFNFWRTTLLDLLDTAPIDVGVAHTSVAKIHHAVAFQERLVLFSDSSQFVLSGGDVLSPRTITIAPVLEFENLDSTGPISTARGVYFPYKRGDYSGIREMYVLGGDSEVYEAEDVTAVVPRYISGEISQLSSSTLEDVLIVLSSGATDRLYVYKHLWVGTEKAQSAWSTYTFGPGASVLSANWIESTLYLVIQRTEGVFLEKMEISTRVTDPGKDFLTHLDRRIQKSDCSSSYNSTTDQTTIQLTPWDIESDVTLRVVGKDGVIYKVLSTDKTATPNTVTVDGDITSDDFWIGQEYTMKYRFAQPILAEQTDSGVRSFSAPVQKLRRGYITYHDSAFFEVTVQINNRDAYTYSFTGAGIGMPDKVVGQLKLSDGVFTFPIQGRPRESTIEIVSNSHLPCHLTSAEWETMYQSRGQRYRG